MKHIFYLLNAVLLLTCQPSWKASGGFVRHRVDTLTILPSQIDSENIINDSPEFRHIWHGNLDIKPPSFHKTISQLDSVIQFVSFRMGWKPNHSKITVNWYGVPEIKILKTNRSAFNDLSDEDCGSHHVVNEVLPQPEFSPELELCYKREFDQIPNKKLNNAFSSFLAGSELQPSGDWFRIDHYPTLSEICNPESEWANDHYLTKDALIFFFRKLNDPEKIYSILKTVDEDGKNIPSEWNELWISMEIKPNNAASEKPIIFLKGFNYSHEGYRGSNGYSSESAKQSMNELSRLNANAVALIPYGFMASHSESTPIYWANRAGSENDESIIYSGKNAKKMGFYVMLKPQLWLRFGRWCGELKMENENDWLQLEKYYRNWILHYAFIANKNKFDALCIGVELLEFTRARPEFFKQLIRDVRLVYNGEITYTANWYDEFERIPFWKETDFIGVSSYFPLSADSVLRRENMSAKLQDLGLLMEQVSGANNKRIVLTEIGFATNDRPWINPHNERESFRYDPVAQSICFDEVFHAWSNKNWSGGFLLWKWSTNSEHHDRERIRFFPNEASQAIIKKWFNLL